MSMSITDKGNEMAKIKDELERIREKEYAEYVSFIEFVCDQEPAVSVDINEVEEDSKESSTEGTSIVHQNTLKAVNNTTYNPKLGA